MKNSGMTMKSMSKWSSLLLTCGSLLLCNSLLAQTDGDIAQIYSPQHDQTFYTAGSKVEIRIKLRDYDMANHFGMSYTGSLDPNVAAVLTPFSIQVETGTGIAYAKFKSLNNDPIFSYTSEIVFEYTVRPGDLALPMRLFGSAGAINPGDGFHFMDGQWRIFNQGRPTEPVVWRYLANTTLWIGGLPDPTFANQNVRLQTVNFASGEPSYTVQKTKTIIGTINAGAAVTNDTTFYLWTSDTNTARVAEQVIGDVSTPFTMLAGQSTVSFHLYGVNEGVTQVYMSPAPNPSMTSTNWVRRQVTVTAPPPPTVSVTIPGMDITGAVTVDESDSPNVPVTVSHSDETWTAPLTVRLDLPSGQQSLAFDTIPKYVTIPANQQSFTIPMAAIDGTSASEVSGILITPYLEDPVASNHFAFRETVNVRVRNLAPTVERPIGGSTVAANTLVSRNFDWEIADVAADLASNMVVTWNWGDTQPATVVTGAVGSVAHTYNAAGTYTVTVTARDKDGKASAPVSFFVEVAAGAPVPYISVIPSAARYKEGDLNASVKFNLFTEGGAFPSDVWVKLEVDYPDPSYTNIVFNNLGPIPILQGETESEELSFTVLDGTELSTLSGINLRPVVVSNNTAVSYFTTRTKNIKVDNAAPKITRVMGQNVAMASTLLVNVPAETDFEFTAQLEDVLPDSENAVLHFDFGDGTPVSTVVTPLGGGRARGALMHRFADFGSRDVLVTRDYVVEVWATDKDGGESTSVSFVVRVGPPPMVRILTPVGAISEKRGVEDIIVQLSSGYTQAVTVVLSVTPGNSPDNGIINLQRYDVIFPSGVVGQPQELPVRILLPRDGTERSENIGFTIMPSVLATVGAVNFFKEMNPGNVTIYNEDPELSVRMPVLPNENGIYQFSQGRDYEFTWGVDDVVGDWTNSLPMNRQMRVSWFWSQGDPITTTYSGRSGSATRRFEAVGEVNIEVEAIDKDGGSHRIQFKGVVLPSKKMNVVPIGPVTAGRYAGAAGLGNGLIYSDEATTRYIEQNIFTYQYDANAISATLRAVPYKVGTPALGDDNGTYVLTNYINRVQGLPGVTAIGTPGPSVIYDSFFYVWAGGQESGLSENAMIPVATPVTVVTLPQTTGAGPGAMPGVAAGQVEAIFSREYRWQDNLGDINLDGIPDIISLRYGLPELVGSDLTPVNVYNRDQDAEGNEVGDFLPRVSSTGGGFRDGEISFAPDGEPFTAILEVRGFHQGLNDYNVGRQADGEPTDGPLDEPGATLNKGGGTDPTRVDTDGDGFPDGWEYYFWYNAKINGLEGMAYDPYNVAQGTVIPSKTIVEAFDPLVPAIDFDTGMGIERDLDNDGLYDIEELTIGTNPIHWDTDGDGICDGWEIMMGLNPNRRDGHLNPDGDYMAYAITKRQWAYVVDNEGVTNTFLARGAVVGDTVGHFTRWYHYGNDDAPIALGRSISNDDLFAEGAQVVAIAEEEVEVVLVHNQVYQEFGFDPRTAWGPTINPQAHPDRFPLWLAFTDNTRPFTSYDEYLVMKYMSELRLNGAGAAIGTGNMDQKSAEWRRFSTHPHTPDSDVAWGGPDGTTVIRADGMPDGWELYVSLPAGRPCENTDLVISPWNAYDGSDADSDGDRLNNRREFHGTDCSIYYVDPELYAETAARRGIVTITRDEGDQSWINKFWPTNPHSQDTDGDGVSDYYEGIHFRYGEATDNGTACIVGGGLNPNSMDTDRDGLPDGWEVQYQSTEEPVAALAVTQGMDGTVQDALQDYDSDGLLNYQEYWVQALRHLRYDVTTEDLSEDESITGLPVIGQPMDLTFAPSEFFAEVANGVRAGNEGWDQARYPNGLLYPRLWVMLPVGDPVNKRYVGTDPRDPDSDGDGMDDYYELFHGLNPILGDEAQPKGDIISLAFDGVITARFNDWWNDLLEPIPMDFVAYPWLTGLPQADPDADGLRNFEEMIVNDVAAPAAYNTDPSPLWLTDVTSPESVTARFYTPYNLFDLEEPVMWFWPVTEGVPLDYMMYSFEMNEGYDTDNDGVSDKDELMLTSTPASNPQDHDDPMRRQAIWFSGENSAAQGVIPQYAVYEDSLRSFTVELWFAPERLDVPQVLIERAVAYDRSDLSTPDVVVRANFRIGIDEKGVLYGLFENAGAHDEHTGRNIVKSIPGRLTLDSWSHVVLRMDGVAGELSLWLDGVREASASTTMVPANGVVVIEKNPGSPDYLEEQNFTATPGLLTLGASNLDPFPELDKDWSQFVDFFQGYIDEVRVWDGARTDIQIHDNYSRRFTRVDQLANRKRVSELRAEGGTRVAGFHIQLPPELLYHYTFDNLFASHRPESVVKVPRGFNHPDCAINRPDDYVVGWWAGHPLASTVYDDYGYVPWIENSIDHLPLDGFQNIGGRGVYRESLVTLNSIYWGHYAVGAGLTNQVPQAHGLERFEFPNSNNPYGHWYETASPSSGGGVRRSADDLLPLGDAFAKDAIEMWDGHGASTVWADNGLDSDEDGLPDWWEELHGLDPYSGAGVDGWHGDKVGDGVSNGERYLIDVAHGWREGDTLAGGPSGPVQTADLDQDGLPDWWENIYDLKVETHLSSAEAMASEHGAFGDPDRDGLHNLAEYIISEHYTNLNLRLSPRKFKSMPTQLVSDYFLQPLPGRVYLGEMFTDHDFMEAAWELKYAHEFVNPFVYDAHLDPDQDGWSNWAESRFGNGDDRSDPTRIEHVGPDGELMKDYPVPLIEAYVGYNGEKRLGNVVIQAFTDATMKGLPDAIFTVTTPDQEEHTKQLGVWEPVRYRGVLSPGAVQPASIEIAFVDQTPYPLVQEGVGNWDLETRTAEAVIIDVVNPTNPDVLGILRARDAYNQELDVGTINYSTGAFTLDLDLLENMVLSDINRNEQGVAVVPRLDVQDAYMVATYTSGHVATWPKRLYLTDADEPEGISIGRVMEGMNYFFAFLDLNNNGVWDVGEPCATDEGFGVDIGFDRNQIKFELTDYTAGYPRFDLNGLSSEEVYFGNAAEGSGDSGTAGGLESHTRVWIRRLTAGGGSQPAEVFVGELLPNARGLLHEADVLSKGQLALDWGYPGIPASILNSVNYVTYGLYVGHQPTWSTNMLVKVFTNYLDSARARVSTVSPIDGGYVFSARPTFKWQLPNGLRDNKYPVFALQIRRNGGAVIYTSDPFKAPIRDVNGQYTWEAPLYADAPLPSGEMFDSNRVYEWRVIALNAKFSTMPTAANSTEWSTWKKFRLDTRQERSTSAGYGMVQARVKYYGPANGSYQTTPSASSRVEVPVIVEAFNNAGFAGEPVARYVLDSLDRISLTNALAPAINASLNGLLTSKDAGNYYLRAFFDHNRNGVRDVWESWGYANHYGLKAKVYDPLPVEINFAVAAPTVDIIIEDADTDQDWFPDAWEFEQARGVADFLANIGAVTGDAPDARFNMELSLSGRNVTSIFTTLAMGSTDQDGDGLDDISELLWGSDPLSASTSGDGFKDGDKVDLGLAPMDSLNLTLRGIAPSATALNVGWDLTVQRSARPGLLGITAVEEVGYQVLFTESLSDANWRVVGSGKVVLDGVQELQDTIQLQGLGQDAKQGFFRIRLLANE